jgi:hypothetical protein
VGSVALLFGQVTALLALMAVWSVHGEIGSSLVPAGPSIHVLHTCHPLIRQDFLPLNW